jgi:hypothetical protein
MSQRMNLDGLTPEQLRFIFDLSKRIVTLESKLVKLQDRLIRVDRTLTAELAKEMTYLNLN